MALTYNSQEHQFELPIDGEAVSLLIPFPFADLDQNGNVFALSDGETFTLQEWTKNVAENDIHEVKVKSIAGERDFRIGWLFPYAALISTEHDFAENPHFLYYVFHAYSKLLNDDDIVTRLKNGDGWEGIINEKISQNKNLLIIENQNLRQETNLKELEISMFMFGYSHGREFESSKLLSCQENENNTITLTRCKDIMDDARNSYINEYVEEFLNSFIGEKIHLLPFSLSINCSKSCWMMSLFRN